MANIMTAKSMLVDITLAARMRELCCIITQRKVMMCDQTLSLSTSNASGMSRTMVAVRRRLDLRT